MEHSDLNFMMALTISFCGDIVVGWVLTLQIIVVEKIAVAYGSYIIIIGLGKWKLFCDAAVTYTSFH